MNSRNIAGRGSQQPRPFLLTLFTGVRGRGILRSSQGKQNHMIARCVQHVQSMCGVERIPNQRRDL